MIDADGSVARGLAGNPGAPDEVLVGLLRAAPEVACQGFEGRGDLPAAVQDAMMGHESVAVRVALARHPHIDPDVRRRLLADDDWRVWVRAFGHPGQAPLGDEVLTALLTRIEGEPLELFTVNELWDELYTATGYDRRLYHLAAVHPDARVRRHAAAVPDWLDASVREGLEADPEPEIRAAVAAAMAERRRVMQPADLPEQHSHGFWYILQRPLSRALVDQVVAGGDDAALSFVGPNPSTPPEVVAALLTHPVAEVRRGLAERTDLSHEQLLALAADPAAEVRTAVSVHPGLTEPERAGIDIDVTTVRGNGHYGRREECRDDDHAFVDESVPELADAVRWARSVNPLLRRRAARRPELPADLVAALAEDPDQGVRVLLARHHPDAPPALLLRCFLEYRGARRQLAASPRFPVVGLSVFADHADPGVRRLVTLDPDADPALVERLCADPDLDVRQIMAACPRLPTAAIIALLDDPELAEHAAANPALPIDRMHRILAAASA